MRISFPPDLPVCARVDDITAALREHQVVVVAGETGSGKTTQLPKICLAAGRAADGRAIAHTQPRRIAARAVAERIAEELGVELGREVGYQVRFTRKVGRAGRLTVMTDGVLLAQIAHDPELRAYDTVIVDEAHERSLNIDFLLGYLRRLLPHRPDLKVVITSATIDPQRFAEHFGGAPVIEVSGRTYPVEVRYRPVADDDDPLEALVSALAEVQAEGPGDTLVFLSGEREIRDAADHLRGLELRDTEVLPLFGRLSAAEQHRVFAAHRGRRVVLATNVAETSLTVPGIRYVVDTGTARISRYSHRLKVQRLPIEKISQASARQRAGRCGRVAAGVCIRLYDEEDFAARPAYTDPEILRTNLAAVLLQMAALRLGDIEDFPFLDPPDRRAVRDGLALLDELGALERAPEGTARRLTPVGRRLARLPLDPRLGRMVLAAADHGVVRDLLVVAAGLTIQDPRERPADAAAQADALHARFADPAGDVMTLLNLWRHLEEQQAALSGSAFRRTCRAEYLHYLRIREWQDLVAQLTDIATRDLHLPVADGWGHADAVHQAMLSGLLSHIGLRDTDGRGYVGARGARFVLWPGSVLARKPPRWVVAAELVETSRLFARMVARIDPAWIEPAAAHLVVRTYSEPHWDARRGAVMGYERVTLFGIPIVTRRRVGYARVDPALARELFLRHALVEGDWDAPHRFLRHNEDVLARVGAVEDKLRRHDVAPDEDALFAFYDTRVPTDVVSARHFDAWWKRTRREQPDLLDLSLADVLPAGVAVRLAAYPDTWRLAGRDLRVSYRFAPGEPDDGVTVHVPLAALPAVDQAALSWQVPGRREELAVAWLRLLAKEVRRALVPIPDTARAALAELSHEREHAVDFRIALARAVRRVAAVDVDLGALTPAALPADLRVHVAVESDGDVLAVGDDVDVLRARLAGRLRAEAARAAPQLQRSGLRAWPGGDLPREVPSVTGVTGFPALVDEGGATVGVQVLGSAAEQSDAMRLGTRRLLLLTVPSPARGLVDGMTAQDKLALSRDTGGRPAEVVRDCIAAAVDDLVARAGGPAWTAAGFDRLRAEVAAALPRRAAEVLAGTRRVLAATNRVRERLAAPAPASWQPSLDDMRAQLAALVPADVASTVGAARLVDVERYVAGIVVRLDRLRVDLLRDLDAMQRVHAVEDAWHEALDRLPAGRPVPDALAEVRWMLEELRVSLFAQALGTPYRISEQRVRKAIAVATAGR